MKKEMPPGFPLLPIDAVGDTIVPGDNVKIDLIPLWLIHDLPEVDKVRLKQYEGKILQVNEFDKYGYVWLNINGQSAGFSIKPKEVRLVKSGE